MAKTGEKANKVITKKVLHPCECGEEMKRAKSANNNKFYWWCQACNKLFDKRGKEKVF